VLFFDLFLLFFGHFSATLTPRNFSADALSKYYSYMDGYRPELQRSSTMKGLFVSQNYSKFLTGTSMILHYSKIYIHLWF